MRTLKFSSIAIAMLMTSFCIFLAPTVTIYANNYIYKIDTGPRTVVQLMSSITVVQEIPELLQVVVVRQSDEQIVYQTSSSRNEIVIPTDGWESGEYVVQTNCEHNDYQEFPVEI